jgi:hypothetical protein
MEVLGPADRADGLACLCVRPFGAGQAPAVPWQPPALDCDCYIAFTGAQPHANWQHADPPLHCVSCATAIQRQGS